MATLSVTTQQIQRLDKIAIGRYGVPSLALMENAGRAVAQEVRKALRNKKGSRVCIVCGVGNNAGDGFVAARHLTSAGIKTDVFLIGRAGQLKHDAAVNYNILKKIKFPVYAIGAGALPVQGITRADIVVDAIFGVGLSRMIEGPFRRAVETINTRARRVVAVDVPSGLDATTGDIYGVCVRAATTVTFTRAKKGFFRHQGPHHTGKVVVADIGIPRQVVRQVLRKKG